MSPDDRGGRATFAEHVERCAGSFINARRSYIRERRWKAEDWYCAWQTTDLPREVVRAADEIAAEDAP